MRAAICLLSAMVMTVPTPGSDSSPFRTMLVGVLTNGTAKRRAVPVIPPVP